MMGRGLSRRVLAALLSGVLCFGALPCAALAEGLEVVEETGDDEVIEVTADEAVEEIVEEAPEEDVEEESVSESTPEDNEALLNGYIESQFAEQLPEGADEDALFSEANYAGSLLTGVDKAVYDQLKLQIAEVAAGDRDSTELEVAVTDVAQTTWTAEELGVDAITLVDDEGNKTFSEEARTAIKAKMSSELAFNLTSIHRSLLADCPYELYWYDKTATGAVRSSKPSIKSYRYTSSYVTAVYTDPIIFRFTVASDYSAGEYLVDTSVGETIQGAVRRAQSIADAHASEAAVDRLTSFKDEICARTDYNRNVVSGSAYGNPWQLVWVFDDDPNTKVVCEGYAKAFKYLCDLSDMSDIECLAVTGEFGGNNYYSNDPKTERHMWNIVRMEDGRNYLVDVTNCDENHSGSPDLLFMESYVEGDVSSGYVFTAKNSARKVIYLYDTSTTSIFSESDLTLSAEPYGNRTRISSASVVLGSESLVYNGESQVPEVLSVTLDGVELVAEQDFTTYCYNNISAGTGYVFIRGINDYCSSVAKTFTIAKAPSEVVEEPAAQELSYIGDAQELVSEGSASGGTLQYRLGEGEWTDIVPTATNAGTYQVAYRVVGDSNHKNTEATSLEVTIAPASLSEATVTAATQTYDGSAKNPAPVVELAGKTLKADTDYTVAYANNVNAGTAAVTVTGQGNYAGTATGGFTISKATSLLSLRNQKASYTGEAIAYAGQVIRLGSTGELTFAYYSNEELTNEVAPDNVREPGTYYVVGTLAEDDNHRGITSKPAVLEIAKDAAKVSVAPVAQKLTYIGSAQALVSAGEASGGTLQYRLGEEEWTDAVPTAIDAGTYQVAYRVVGDATHADSAEATLEVTIAPASLSKATVTASAQTYDGSAKEPAPVVELAGKTLEAGADYIVAYANNVNAGTATVTITGKGNYTGTAKGTFAIAKGAAVVTTAPKAKTLTYTGKARALVSAGKAAGGTMQYRIGSGAWRASVPVATNAGTYEVWYRVAGDANHTSSAAKRVIAKIKPVSLAKATVTVADQAYNGSARKPAPRVVLAGKILKSQTDYTVTYKANVKPGVATVTVKGKGNYTGTASAQFFVRFKDLSVGHEYYADVQNAAALGIIGGYTGDKAGTFGPEDSLTRGQVAVMLWNLADNPPASAGAKSFKDVKDGAYYAKAVAWASGVGVVSGYDSEKFGPNDNVTHQQLCVMVANYARRVGGLRVVGSQKDFEHFADRGLVAAYARTSVGFCFRSGITKGFGGKVDPQGYATRAETASMLYRLYLLMK